MGPGPAGIPQLEYLFSRLVCTSVPIGYTILLVILVIAGIKYITSGGEPKAISSAHQTATWGLLGILFLAISWLILLLIQNFTGLEVTKFTLSSLPGVEGFTGSCWNSAPVAPTVIPTPISNSNNPTNPSLSQTSSTISPSTTSMSKACNDYPDNIKMPFNDCREITLPYLGYKSAVCFADCKLLQPYLINLQTYLDNPDSVKQEMALKKLYSTWRSILKDGGENVGLYDVNYICAAGSTGEKTNRLASSDLKYRPPYSNPGITFYPTPNYDSVDYIQISKMAGLEYIADPDQIAYESTKEFVEDYDQRGMLLSQLFVKYPKGVIPLESYETAIANSLETKFPPANYTSYTDPTPSQWQEALENTRGYYAWHNALLGLACDDGNYYRIDSLMPQKLK